MVRSNAIVLLFLWVLVALGCLCQSAESRGIKKWQAHLKKKPFTSSPHISATFRIVPYKSHKKPHSHAHKRHRSSDFPLHDPAFMPKYYLAASYPAWRTHSGASLRKLALPDLLRRSDAFADIAATPFVDLSTYNGIFNADAANVISDRSDLRFLLNDPFTRSASSPLVTTRFDGFSDNFGSKRRSSDEVILLDYPFDGHFY